MTSAAIPTKPDTPELSALAQALSALKLDRAADALPGLLSAAVNDDLGGPASSNGSSPWSSPLARRAASRPP
jgi:hypothetical protein